MQLSFPGHKAASEYKLPCAAPPRSKYPTPHSNSTLFRAGTESSILHEDSSVTCISQAIKRSYWRDLRLVEVQVNGAMLVEPGDSESRRQEKNQERTAYQVVAPVHPSPPHCAYSAAPVLEVVELEDVVVALVTVVVGADVGVVAPVVVTGGGGEDYRQINK